MRTRLQRLLLSCLLCSLDHLSGLLPEDSGSPHPVQQLQVGRGRRGEGGGGWEHAARYHGSPLTGLNVPVITRPDQPAQTWILAYSLASEPTMAPQCSSTLACSLLESCPAFLSMLPSLCILLWTHWPARRGSHPPGPPFPPPPQHLGACCFYFLECLSRPSPSVVCPTPAAPKCCKAFSLIHSFRACILNISLPTLGPALTLTTPGLPEGKAGRHQTQC